MTYAIICESVHLVCIVQGRHLCQPKIFVAIHAVQIFGERNTIIEQLQPMSKIYTTSSCINCMTSNNAGRPISLKKLQYEACYTYYLFLLRQSTLLFEFNSYKITEWMYSLKWPRDPLVLLFYFKIMT